MKSLAITVIILIVFTGHGSACEHGNAGSHFVRRKRDALIFPPASVLQLTVGVTAVLDLDVGNASGQMSYAFQQNVALPTNYTQFMFPPTAKIGRSLNLDDHLQHFFTRSTMNGTECLKKVICQVAETPLRGGLLEEILTFAFTPSNHEHLFAEGTEEIQHPFFVSESIGRYSGDCHSMFPYCQQSPLDLISQLDGDDI